MIRTASYVLLVLNLFLIIWVLKSRTELILRPTFQLSVIYLLSVSLGGTYYLQDQKTYSGHEWKYLFVFSLFPTISLLFSVLLYKNLTRRYFLENVRTCIPIKSNIIGPTISTGLLLILVAIYSSAYSLSNTGLYSMIFEPEKLELARAQSSTLLESDLARYSLTLIEKVVGPIVASFWTLDLIVSVKSKHRLRAVRGLLGISMALLSSSLSGARSPGLLIVLTVIFTSTLFLWNDLNLKKITGILLVFLFLSPIATILSFRDFSPKNILCQTVNIIDRAVYRGSIDNFWYLEYQKENGYVGIASIPKVAAILGQDSININNEVAKANLSGMRGMPKTPFNRIGNICAQKFDRVESVPTYSEAPPIDSESPREDREIVRENYVSANATFVTNLITSFGLIGIFLTVISLLILDSIFIFMAKMNRVNSIVGVCCYTVPTITLVFSQINTGFLSNGMLLIPLILYFIDKMNFHKKASQ